MATVITADAPIPSKASAAARLDYLDGVRALAALYVFLIHGWTSQMGLHTRTGPLGWATNWILYAHFAVDTFIVLSGFCLILPVARHGALRGGMWLFYARRARRILPTFYAAFLLCAVLRLIEHHMSPQSGALTWRGFVANVLLLQDLYPNDLGRQFSGPFWSVAVEWKIYFLFPLMVWMLLRRGAIPVLLFTAAVGYAIAGLLHWHDPLMPLEHTCPWYVFLFGMGVCAGYAAHAPGKAIPARTWLAGFVVSLLAYSVTIALWPLTPTDITTNATHYALIDPPAGAMVATGLALLACGAARARALLSWPPLVRLGTFGYSMYLLHSALLKVCNNVLDRLHIHGSLHLFALLLCAPFIIGAAYLFFLVCERPFLTRRPSEPPAETALKAVLSPAP